jgi:cyclic pyranopterin phosphate synthase
MTDSTGRVIDYLRISITDRCNLRCIYCMPPEGICLLPHSNILTYDEITSFSKLAVSKGIRKIRITGGEPLVRKDVEKLIALLASIEGLADLSLTTNGQLLEEKAALLKSAGLQRINISLDTLDPEHYRLITRGGTLNAVLSGIRAAQRAGFEPIKINCVINMDAITKNSLQNEHQEAQKEAMLQFAQKEGLELRFIHCMSLEQGTFSVVEGGSGGDCTRCNRLRLTANGMLKPCLFNDIEYDIRAMGYSEALEAAVLNKPPKGTYNSSGNFYAIGG